MPDWINSVVAAGATTVIPIFHNDSQWIWEIQQVTVTYDKNTDQPNVGILKNNLPAVSAAPMQPGPGLNFPNAGLSQTFAGLPYIYSEVKDNISVVITQGTAGAKINVFVQYWRYSVNDPDIQQRKATG